MSDFLDAVAKSAIIGSKTGFERFSSAALASGAVTLITEFGDRTFFIAAILAARDSKWLVWWGASLALWVQTIASSLLGAILHRFPNPSNENGAHIPFDDYIAGTSLVIFGILSFRDAWKGSDENDDEGGDVRNIDLDTESQLSEYPLPPALMSESTREDTPIESHGPMRQTPRNSFLTTKQLEVASFPIYTEVNGGMQKKNRVSLTEGLLVPDDYRRISNASSRNIKEASRIVVQEAYKHGSRRVLIKAFSTIFVAEIGDRSMFSTIALAAAQNPYGVALGACLAHGLVTLVAVRSASVISRFVSERVTHIIAGCLFLTLGILSVANGIVQQQFHP